MTQLPEFKRLANGSIDIDYYRKRALTERKVLMTGFVRAAFSPCWSLLALIAANATAPLFNSRRAPPASPLGNR